MKRTNKQMIKNADNNYLLQGDLTLKTVAGIYQASLLDFKNSEKLSIDLSEVKVFDSSAISLLLSWIRDAKAQSAKEVIFKHIPADLQTLIKENKLDMIIRSSA